MVMEIATQGIPNSTFEGDLTNISSNFTNKHNMPTILKSFETQIGNVFRAGSKCALLHTMETAQYKFTPVQTKVYTSSKWRTLTENEILSQINDLNCNNNDTDLLQNVTVLNWNIACGEENKTDFYKNILTVIQRTLPDFCCLQNVQHDFRAWLENSGTIREHYYLSNSNLDYIDFESRTHNGVLTLARWPGELVEYPFIDTQIGGYLLAYQTVINGIPLVVANSKHQTSSKGRTISHAHDILSFHGNVIWLGNFGNEPDDCDDDIPGLVVVDVDTAGEDIISIYQDVELVVEGKHSDSDKVLVRSDRMKPEHYFNLNMSGDENGCCVVGVIQIK